MKPKSKSKTKCACCRKAIGKGRSSICKKCSKLSLVKRLFMLKLNEIKSLTK